MALAGVKTAGLLPGAGGSLGLWAAFGGRSSSPVLAGAPVGSGTVQTVKGSLNPGAQGLLSKDKYERGEPSPMAEVAIRWAAAATAAMRHGRGLLEMNPLAPVCLAFLVALALAMWKAPAPTTDGCGSPHSSRPVGWHAGATAALYGQAQRRHSLVNAMDSAAPLTQAVANVLGPPSRLYSQAQRCHSLNPILIAPSLSSCLLRLYPSSRDRLYQGPGAPPHSRGIL